MKIILKGTLILMILLNVIQINAQNDTENFIIKSEKVSTEGHDIFVSSTIEKSGNLLVWNQQGTDGINSNSFEIISSEIDWNQEHGTGSISFNMVIEGYQSVFTLTGQSNELSALITITMSSTEQKKYLFSIDTITF